MSKIPSDLQHMLPPPDAGDDEATARIATWTPERQIAHMLALCEAQMESALAESDVAVDSLVQSFSGLIEAAQIGRAHV